MNTEIIGIYSEGYGSGKDSVANVLAFEFDYIVFGFSEVMKRHIYENIVNSIFPSYNLWLEYCETHKYDSPDQEGAWVRKLLQGYGQMFRHKDPDYWVKEWELYAKEYKKVAVPSVRYPNEAIRIKKLGGLLVKVVRPGIDVDDDSSEVSMNSWAPDYIIMNDGPLWELKEKVMLFMKNKDMLCLKMSPLVKEISTVS